MVIRLGLIGAGRWGRNLIRTIRAMEGVALARVMSRNAETPAWVAADTAVVDDWRAVTDANDLDGVVIATPPQLHVAMASRALAQGLPVLIEKPLALEPGEATALGAAAAGSAAFAMVDHTHVFSAAFEALLGQSKRLGRPLGVAAEAGNWGPFRTDAPVLFDWGAHDVAMLLALFGESPTRVAARCVERRWLEDAGEGATWGLDLNFGDAAARIELSNLLQTKRRRFCVNFATATLLYDDLAPDKLTLHPSQPDLTIPAAAGTPVPLPDGSPLQRVLARFLAAIERGADDTASLDMGIRATHILAACDAASRRSIDEGNAAWA